MANSNSNPPLKNQEFTFPLTLESYASPGTLQANPTIAAGDFQISKDGGTFANLTNLPTVTPTGGKRVEVVLTATETNCNNWLVVWEDQSADKEWRGGSLGVLTT